MNTAIDISKTNFVSNLKVLMEDFGIETNSQLSKATNVGGTPIKEFLNGTKKTATEKTLKKFADYFEITTDDLLELNLSRLHRKTDNTDLLADMFEGRDAENSQATSESNSNDASFEFIKLYCNLPKELRKVAYTQLKALSDLTN